MVGLWGLAGANPGVVLARLLPLALRSGQIRQPSVRMLLSLVVSGDQTETAESVHLFGVILNSLICLRIAFFPQGLRAEVLHS